ncbi:nucleotidyltransferase family protein [Vibrio sp.]|uniref:nucleotidyltransferase family protein n=1 Tax=Vibrio sp. TaxID=678 RepID=UPI003D11F725
MKKIDEIKKKLELHKEELKQRYNIKELGIFGSYVRGEERKDSDLDVLTEFEDGAKIGLLEFISVENYLSDLLGVKVDLVEKSALKPRIGRHILNEVVYL